MRTCEILWRNLKNADHADRAHNIMNANNLTQKQSIPLRGPTRTTRTKSWGPAWLSELEEADEIDAPESVAVEDPPPIVAACCKLPAVAISRHEMFIPTSADTRPAICRCGSRDYHDIPIHGGQSTRRDCASCGRFLAFPVWYRSIGEGTR
jgi:hypothetical protein